MPQLAEQTRLFTADEYHAMANAGILTEDDRVELVDGRILTMTPIGFFHVNAVNRLTRLLVRHTDPHAEVSVQNPVRFDDLNEPQPDIALLRPTRDRQRVPHASDALLLVEVSGSSLRYDRDDKLPRYARAGVPEVWIVALDERRVHVYREPSGGEYRATRTLGSGEQLEIAALPDVEALSVDDVLDS